MNSCQFSSSCLKLSTIMEYSAVSSFHSQFGQQDCIPQKAQNPQLHKSFMYNDKSQFNVLFKTFSQLKNRKAIDKKIDKLFVRHHEIFNAIAALLTYHQTFLPCICPVSRSALSSTSTLVVSPIVILASHVRNLTFMFLNKIICHYVTFNALGTELMSCDGNVKLTAVLTCFIASYSPTFTYYFSAMEVHVLFILFGSNFELRGFEDVWPVGWESWIEFTECSI